MSGERGGLGFEVELDRAARSLAAEPLPRDLLDAPSPASARDLTAAIGSGLVAVAAVVVLAVWLGGWLAPSGGGEPALRPAAEIELELRASGFRCATGISPSPAPRATAVPDARPQVVCVAPASLEPVVGALILGLDGSGAIAEVHAKVGLLEPVTPAGEASREALLGRFIGVALASPSDAAAARDWLIEQLPIEPGDRVTTTIRELEVVAERDTTGGGYQLQVGAPADGSPSP